MMYIKTTGRLSYEPCTVRKDCGSVRPPLEKYSPDQPRDDHGRWTSGGSGLTNSAEGVKLDSNGVPFNYPAAKVLPKDYAEFMDQVGRTWHDKYEGKELCRYSNTKKIFWFENRGIGDYNIYRIERNKRND